ncbi:hypothetical protein GCK32_013087 [Trichostrongylus colubriformis]|uniref:Uncharacterized protein n=2 Tax=Trichostrongylus colubriformis TaxID=6319 RepID=A0AAN8F7E6_TRICO
MTYGVEKALERCDSSFPGGSVDFTTHDSDGVKTNVLYRVHHKVAYRLFEASSMPVKTYSPVDEVQQHESEELDELDLEFDSLIIESDDDDESDESQGALVSPMEPPNEDDELEDEEGSSQPIRGVWSDTIMRPKRWSFDDNLCGILVIVVPLW